MSKKSKTIEQLDGQINDLLSTLIRTTNALNKARKTRKRLLSKPAVRCSSVVEHAAVNRDVAGSSPAAGATDEVKPIPPALVKTEFSDDRIATAGLDFLSGPTNLDIPTFMRRGLAAQNAADEAVKAELISRSQQVKKAKAAARIAKMKAKQSGETRAMPLSGKAALAKINAS